MTSKAVWVYHADRWCKAHLLSTEKKNKKSVHVVELKGGSTVTANAVFPVKHKGRKFLSKQERCGSRTSKHLGRAVVPRVEAVFFMGPGRHGDYAHMLRLREYKHALHLYNENMHQWRDKDDTRPGAGNACARPHRNENAAGIPTGEYGGFKHLDGYARDAILQAKDEIVNKIVANNMDPDAVPYSVVYYSSDHNSKAKYGASTAPHIPIGSGVFELGADVVVFLTRQILDIPKAVAKKIVEQRRLMRV